MLLAMSNRRLFFLIKFSAWSNSAPITNCSNLFAFISSNRLESSCNDDRKLYLFWEGVIVVGSDKGLVLSALMIDSIIRFL